MRGIFRGQVSPWQPDSSSHQAGSTWLPWFSHYKCLGPSCPSVGGYVKVPVLDRCQTQYDMLSDLLEDSSRNHKKKSILPNLPARNQNVLRHILKHFCLFAIGACLLLMIYVTNSVGFLPPWYWFSCLCLVIVNLPDCLLRCICVSCRKHPCFVCCRIFPLCRYSGNLCWNVQRVKN